MAFSHTTLVRRGVSSQAISVGIVLLIILAGFASYTLLLGTTSTGSSTSQPRSSSKSSSVVTGSTNTGSAVSQSSSSVTVSLREVGCASDPTALTHKVVQVRGFNYVPANITVVIAANNTIQWVNRDLTNHTVISDDALFDSGRMSTSATFTCTFNQVGTFSYHCSIHPFMHGKIVARLP